jgi:hypothetical protein
MVADPFRAPDCTTEVDGACAVLVTSTSRARDLRRRPVVIRGAAYVAGKGSGLDAGDALLWDDLSRNYTGLLAEDLWGGAGMRPDDADMAQFYDCFSSSVLFALEGLGITGRGESGAFIRDGNTLPGGRLPMNTNGGLLNEGYLHGMNTVVEAVVQLQGLAGDRMVPNAETCVVTSGALTDGSALVLSSSGRRCVREVFLCAVALSAPVPSSCHSPLVPSVHRRTPRSSLRRARGGSTAGSWCTTRSIRCSKRMSRTSSQQCISTRGHGSSGGWKAFDSTT